MNTCLLPQKVGCTQGYHARRWRVHRVVVLEGRFYKGSLYTEFSVTLEGGIYKDCYARSWSIHGFFALENRVSKELLR